MSEFAANLNRSMKKQLIYLKVVYFVGTILPLLYIVRFNFEYQVSDYNFQLLIMWVIQLFVPPFFLYGQKSYIAAATTVMVMDSAFIIYFIYLSGGLDAPGVFWLATIPLGSAFLLRSRGAFFGYTVVFFTLVVFGYLKIRGIAPHLILSKINYGYEKMYNLGTFLALAAYMSHYYMIKVESRQEDDDSSD
jgi:hypothetical protein